MHVRRPYAAPRLGGADVRSRARDIAKDPGLAKDAIKRVQDAVSTRDHSSVSRRDIQSAKPAD